LNNKQRYVDFVNNPGTYDAKKETPIIKEEEENYPKTCYPIYNFNDDARRNIINVVAANKVCSFVQKVIVAHNRKDPDDNIDNLIDLINSSANKRDRICVPVITETTTVDEAKRILDAMNKSNMPSRDILAMTEKNPPECEKLKELKLLEKFPNIKLKCDSLNKKKHPCGI
jgi:RNase H-fold protein (predicted Holliday junction resolvase)